MLGMTMPFGIWPYTWGMKGQTRELARAEYDLDGEELERKKADIIHKNDKTVLTQKLLDIDLKYKNISHLEYDIGSVNLLHSDDKEGLDQKLLEIDLKHGKITQIAYDKESATLKGKPWVTVLSIEPDPDTPSSGNIELDWNDEFVSNLQEKGYLGATPEMIVDVWLGELCKNIALEHYSGTGTFDEDVGATTEQTPPLNSDGTRVVK